MSRIYKNQSSLTIRLTTGVDITGALTKRIHYKKPSGSTGYWTATSYNATSGILQYVVTSTDTIDEAGMWKFRAYVKFSDGTEAYGDVAEQFFNALTPWN